MEFVADRSPRTVVRICSSGIDELAISFSKTDVEANLELYPRLGVQFKF